MTQKVSNRLAGFAPLMTCSVDAVGSPWWFVGACCEEEAQVSRIFLTSSLLENTTKLNLHPPRSPPVLRIPDWLLIYDLFPPSFRSTLPLFGPSSQASLDLILDRPSNTVNRPTTSPPSPEYSAAFHFVKQLLTFKTYLLNRADYEMPLGKSFRTRWGGGDCLLLAAHVKEEMRRRQKSWGIEKEEIMPLVRHHLTQSSPSLPLPHH